MIRQICRRNQRVALVYRKNFCVQCGHFIFLLTIIVNFEEPPPVAAEFVKGTLIFNIVHKKFNEHTGLTAGFD